MTIATVITVTATAFIIWCSGLWAGYVIGRRDGERK